MNMRPTMPIPTFPNPPPIPGMMAPMMSGLIKGKGPQPLDRWIDLPPNHTVYINNLNEKINRDEITSGLREVLGQYGKILDIVCYTKIKKCKGQAWVVFEDIESAKLAVKELQNFPFFNKPMRIAFSKNTSDATLRRNGQEPRKRVRPEKKKSFVSQ